MIKFVLGGLTSLTVSSIRRQMDVNFFGVVDVTRVAMQVMRERNKVQGGLIQQISSIGAHFAGPQLAFCAPARTGSS